MRTLRVLLLTAVAVVLVAVPSSARAACSQPTASHLLEMAAEGERSVFVGTVVHGGDVARLAVDEVWSGPDLAPEVAVRTGPDQPPWPASRVLRRASSVDADLLLGWQYLVATHGDFATTLCSSMVADAEVLADAPLDARAPTIDGLRGYRPGPFDTALGATVLAALIGTASLIWWGRRLDRAAPGSPSPDAPTRAAGRGVLYGALVGLGGAAVVELATTTTRQLYPTDVGIIGFTLVFGAPISVLVGAFCWWRDRPTSTVVRFALAALPVVLVGAVQVGLQWSAQ